MRVLNVFDNVALVSGGPAIGFREQADALRRRGVELEVVTTDAAGTDADTLGVPVHKLGTNDSGLTGSLVRRLLGPTYAYTPQLVPWMRANGPRFDAVISNGLWTYSVYGTYLGLKGSNVPHFVYAHGMLDPWFKHNYPGKHLKKQVYWSLALGKALEAADAVLFTATAEKELARGVFAGYEKFRGQLVDFGIRDVPPETAGQHAAFRNIVPQLGGRPYILFLSRIHEKKGCDFLLQAFAKVCDGVPDLQLVMAGPGMESYVAGLKDLANRAGIADRVHWTGMVTGDAKFGALYGAQAFALPSHQENFGIAVAEALACGRPVLITDKINIWQEIERSGGGIVGTDSVASTAESLRRFLALDEPGKTVMGQRARAAFLEHFEAERTADSIVSLVLDRR